MPSTESLTALTSLDGRYESSTSCLRLYFSEYGLIKYRVFIEIRWLIFMKSLALEGFPSLDEEDIEFLKKLESISVEFAKEIKIIESITNHDLKAVEYFIKQRLEESGRDSLIKAKEFVHFACTSEDINNLAYALMLRDGVQCVLRPKMMEVMKSFANFARETKNIPMLSLTHGQPATPTTFGKEFGLFGYRLAQQLLKLDKVDFYGKFNGAVGNFNSHMMAFPELNWPSIAESFVQTLGLTYQNYSTQIECHDYVAELCDSISRYQTILIGASQDIWTYISRNRLILKGIEGEVGSSTMPHKVNPIDFENCEGNLGLSNSLLKFFGSKLLISRMQRDLSDSTVLRNIGTAFGFTLVALTSMKKGLRKITPDLINLSRELDAHWEVLAEPIQTLLRKEGSPNPYELLKKHTRGEMMNKEQLDKILKEVFPHDDHITRRQLENLSPASYIGIAPQLAEEMAEFVLQIK